MPPAQDSGRFYRLALHTAGTSYCKKRKVFDLAADAAERKDLADSDSEPSAELAGWLRDVREGLAASDELPPPSIDAESLEQLRALGYID